MEDLFRQAIDHLSRIRVCAEFARTHLLYGEWLRRESRRVDARAQLQIACDHFTAIGMEAFAERARHELMATGETVRGRSVETRDELTAQERQIAEMARDGLSNPEIGARLFISRRTVEWHLRHVFTKLGIRSGRELSSAFDDSVSRLVATYPAARLAATAGRSRLCSGTNRREPVRASLPVTRRGGRRSVAGMSTSPA